MRALSNSEIHHIAGAGYREDIVTAAASIYVGSTIGGAATTLSQFAFAVAAETIGSIPCASPFVPAIALMGSMVSPVMYFAAPALAFELAYPGVIEGKIQSYLA